MAVNKALLISTSVVVLFIVATFNREFDLQVHTQNKITTVAVQLKRLNNLLTRQRVELVAVKMRSRQEASTTVKFLQVLSLFNGKEGCLMQLKELQTSLNNSTVLECAEIPN